METIRRIIGAARGGLFRHIQPGRLLRAAMPEVFPVTAAAALLAAYGMPAGMGSLFGAGGSYALPVLGIAFLCAIWCAGMNIYPAFAGTVLGSLAGGRPQGAAAAMLILLCTFLQKKKKRLPEGMRYLYTAAVLTVLYPVFGTLTIQGAAGYFGGICVSVAAAVLMRHALGGIESILGRREVTDERIVTIALLAGVDYVPKCEFVDVYFNGEYNGIYILIERPGIESTKIDIDEANESDITGGYFIEKDIAMKVDFARDMWFDCPYWANQTQDYFVLKQPEPASSELTARMLEYLEEHMKSVHNAVMGISGEDYQKYIDVDSWIDYIIIQEITKNIDGNFKTSCYLYKQSQDDRLYMTAIWDFDIAFGLTAFNNASAEHNDVEDCVGGRGPVGFIAINSSAPWFNALYHNYPDFQARFKQRYKEYRSTLIPEFFALINEQAAYLYNCTAATEEKWEKNFDHGVNFLTNWLTGRIEWLDSQLLDGQSGITDLNYALNVPGGSLEFTSGTDDPFVGSTTVSRGMVGNTVVGGRIAAVSSNAGENNSESDLRLTVTMKAGDTLSFDYCVSSGVDTDRFICTVGTKALMEISGETGWTKYIFTAPIDGRYCFRWSYEKGNDKSAGVDDCAYIDNVELKAVGLDAARGDVNMDGKITLSDSMAALRTALGLDGFDPERRELSDYNCDGAISVEDAVAIAKKVMHIV